MAAPARRPARAAGGNPRRLCAATRLAIGTSSGRRLRTLTVAAALLGLGCLAHVEETQATLNGSTRNAQSTFALGSLGAPSGLVAVSTGHDVALSWTAGTNGTGYRVDGVSNGSSSDCSSASPSQIGTPAATSYADAGRYQPEGTYWCYRVTTTSGAWTSQSGNPMLSARLGVVVSTVAVANGGTANRLDPGDVVTITFNQAIDPATGPVGSSKVCATNATAPSAVILLGTSVQTGSCVASEAVSIGRFSGLGSSVNRRYNAAYAWSNGNKTLAVTIGSRVSGSSNPSISGTLTLAPTATASKLLSSAGAFHICTSNSGGADCLRAATGSF